MSTVCSKCNQAYLETHVCTVETNQSFNKPLAMKLTQILIKHGFTHPFPIQALLAAHQSELDLAVKEARVDEHRQMARMARHTTRGRKTKIDIVQIPAYWWDKRRAALTKGEQD